MENGDSPAGQRRMTPLLKHAAKSAVTHILGQISLYLSVLADVWDKKTFPYYGQEAGIHLLSTSFISYPDAPTAYPKSRLR
jgi:hypothetical protein